MRYFIFLNCQAAHRLVVQRQDRRLGLMERLGLRMHLSLCDACTNFAQQMAVMRHATHQLGLSEMAASEPDPPAKEGR